MNDSARPDQDEPATLEADEQGEVRIEQPRAVMSMSMVTWPGEQR